MNKEREIHVFDVCDTLFYSNTTFDFIEFVLSQNKNIIGKILFKLITLRFSPIFLFLYLLGKVTRLDHIRSVALKLLKNISKVEMEHFSASFYSNFLIKRKVAKTFKYLENAIQNKERVILATSSIEPVIKIISERLKVEYVCSSLDYSNEVFSGKFLVNCTGRKHEFLENILSENEKKNIIVYTDNYSDFKLVSMAHKRFIIVYDNGSKNKWLGLNPQFIKIDK